MLETFGNRVGEGGVGDDVGDALSFVGEKDLADLDGDDDRECKGEFKDECVGEFEGEFKGEMLGERESDTLLIIALYILAT